MSSNHMAADQLENLSKEMDLVVFALEVAPIDGTNNSIDREAMRRQLELIHRKLQDIAMDLRSRGL
jgi:hypothetical protein